MRKKEIGSLMIALFLTLTLLTLAGCGGTQEEAEEVTETTQPETEAAAESNEYGVSLHEFEAKDFEEILYTEEDLSDNDITVMYFWSTSHTGDLQELAVLENQLPAGAALMTYCVDGAKQTDTAMSILTSSGFDGVGLYDGTGDLLSLAAEAEAAELPYMVFLDSSGDQACEPLKGTPQDFGEKFRQQLNRALNSVGGAPIGP